MECQWNDSIEAARCVLLVTLKLVNQLYWRQASHFSAKTIPSSEDGIAEEVE